MADYMGMDTSLIAAQRDAALNALAHKDSSALAEFQMRGLKTAGMRIAKQGATGISTMLLAYVNGRYNNPKLGGKVPYDLLVAGIGIVAHTAVDAFGLPVPGAVQNGVEAVTTGALSSYVAKLGTGFGYEAAKEAKEPWAQAAYPLASGYEGSYSSSSSSSGYEGAYGTLPGSVGALSASEAEIYVR